MLPSLFRAVSTKTMLPLIVGASLVVSAPPVGAQPQDKVPAQKPAKRQTAAYEQQLEAGDKSLEAGRLEEAGSHYKQAIALAPPDLRAYVRWSIGSSYMLQGLPTKAAEEFEIVVNDPASPQEWKTMARDNLALSYGILKRNEEAREQYALALNESAGNIKAQEKFRYSIVQTYLVEGRYSEFRAAMNDFLALPNLSDRYITEAQLSIGMAYVGEGNFAAAIDKYREVLALPTPEKVSKQQMNVTRYKQQAQRGLAHAYAGLALQSEQEVLKSKYLSPLTEGEVRGETGVLQKFQDEWLDQLRGLPEYKPAATPAKAPIAVGQSAPDFTLVDFNGTTQHLSDYRGKKQVLLTFFPKCFTGDCINHLFSLRDAQDQFGAQGVQILAVSVDPAQGPQGQVAFAKAWGFEFPMLPDTERKISMLYGAAQIPSDVSSRMSVLIGTDGLIKIVDKQVNVTSHATDLLAKMKTLNLVPAN